MFVTQIVESEVDNRRGRGGSAFCQTNQTDDFASGYKTAFVSEPRSCSNATTDAVCIHDAVMTINDLMDFIRRFYNVPPSSNLFLVMRLISMDVYVTPAVSP